jgi:energy-coupling factor transport system ATP-binding protein
MWADPKDIRRFRLWQVWCSVPEYQLFEETVYKDIAFGPANYGAFCEEIDRRVQRAAAFCGIDSCFLQRSPLSFPAGRSAVWPLQVCLPWNRGFWCWTNPPPGWTRRAGI